MSTRTVIEINHDYLETLEDPELMLALKRALQGSDAERINRSGFIAGVRWLGQRHHSETLELKVK